MRFHVQDVKTVSHLQRLNPRITACRPNPYHNSTHAADVTQALLCILTQDDLDRKFTDLELFAMVLAAILHDVAHPGLSNSFLSRTQDEQALMYNDQSSNEALSLSIGFKILQAPECNLFINMSREDYFYVRRYAHTCARIATSQSMCNRLRQSTAGHRLSQADWVCCIACGFQIHCKFDHRFDAGWSPR